MLPCPFHVVTGLDCPLCGGQRMLVALWHGQWTEAFWLNPGLAVGAPLLGLWWLWRRELTSQAALVVVGLMLLWAVIRNVLQL